MRKLFTLAFNLFTIALFSQSVTHGPIVGGVTDSSCRVFIRTSAAAAVTIQLATDVSFTNITSNATGSTDALLDSIAIIPVNGLAADTRYYVRAVINNIPSGPTASFETFAAPGSATHQVFISGSCLYDLTSTDSALFVRAAADNPKAFIQSGDWGYPDANSGVQDIYLTNPPTSYAVDMNVHRDFYKLRYSSPNSISFIQKTCVDYMYDDHDFLNDNCADDAVSGFGLDFLGDLGAPKAYSQPSIARLNTMQAYREWFPSFPLVDTTEGIYHSFRAGNCEFFIPDLRAMRTAQANAIKKVNNQWVYSPPSGYSLLGENQLNWLLNGLQNSTATWKFIISSDAYNIAQRFCYDTCLKIGNNSVPYWAPEVSGFSLPNKGYTAVQNFADNWTGFHEEQDSLLHFVLSHNIKNVFMISGDTHNVGLDDGTNSGIPELNCGQLKKANSHDWEITQQFMGYNIWNKGGSGLCSGNNFDDSYSRIEVFGNDSMNLSAVDANGNRIVSWTFMANEPYKYNPNYHVNRIPVAVNDVINALPGNTTDVAVLANDADQENDPLYVNLETNPQHGTAAVNGNNTIAYTPAAGYTGIDTFRYKVCDRANASCYNCAMALVTLNVGTTGFTPLTFNKPKVYPNPASDMLYLALDKDLLCNVTLYNALGEKVQQWQAQGLTGIDISLLPAGNYFVKIMGKNAVQNWVYPLNVIK